MRHPPFGQASVSGTVTQNLRFPGQYFDVESGWNHNGFRDYAPVLGRYIEPDPLGRLGSGNNLYAYVYDNPANLIDPLGLCPECQAQQQNATSAGEVVGDALGSVLTAPASVQLQGQSGSINGPAPKWMHQPDGTMVQGNTFSYQVVNFLGLPVDGNFTLSENITPIGSNTGPDVMTTNTVQGGQFNDFIGVTSDPNGTFQSGYVFSHQLQTFSVTFPDGVKCRLSTVVQQNVWMINQTLMEAYPTVLEP